MRKNRKLLGLVCLAGLSLTLTSANSLVGIVNEKANTIKREEANSETLFTLYYARPDGATSLKNIWFWGSDASGLPGYGMQIFTDEQVTFEQTGDFKWQKFTFEIGKEYECYTLWGNPDSAKEKVKLTAENFSGGFIVTSADGTKQTGDLTLDFGQIEKSPNREVFYVDKGNKISGDVYYDINMIPSYSVTSVRLDYNGFNLPCIEFSTKDDLNFTVNDLKVMQYRYSGGGKIYSANMFNLAGNIRRIGFRKYRIDIINHDVIDPRWKYELQVSEKGSISNYDIDLQTYYSSDIFEENFTPKDDVKLGSTVQVNAETGKKETVFRVWAPFATKVRLAYNLNSQYDEETANKLKFANMEKGEGSVWEVVIPENLGGHAYHYQVTNFGNYIGDARDPYAESAIQNAEESVVVDWEDERLLPEYNTDFKNEFGTWQEVTPSEVGQEKATVSELHVRDFSSDPTWTGKDENVGKFMALTESGLKLEGTETSIGYDYVKELGEAGLTHIQLLPIYDFASVDETKLEDKDYIAKPSQGIFNWGYDPESYNAPEGSYSSNPNDPYARIRELRSVVQAFDKADLGVVMDVVYNHMPGKNGTSFNDIVPDYYFRTQDSSGAGATMNSTRKMFRKFMVDSVSMWAENYKLSGFRFDLMGILDARTMMDCAQAVREIAPEALMYGEGWQMFSSTGDQGVDEMMASQKNLHNFGTPEYSGTGKLEQSQFVGAFNDNYRDSINGGTGNITNWGFMQKAYNSEYTNNEGNEINKMWYGLLGTNPYNHSYYNKNNPGFDSYIYSNYFTGGSVNYTECHDNLTAFDKLYGTMQDRELAYTLSNLGNVITSSGVGVTFYQFGQEFGRTKEVTDEKYLADDMVKKSLYTVDFADGTKHYFSHNSYNTSDKVNSIQWNLVADNEEMVTSFKQTLSVRELISPVTTWDELSSTYISTADNYGNPSRDFNVFNLMVKASDGSTLYYYVNPTQVEKTVHVPYGSAATIIAGENVNTQVSGSMTVSPTSYVVLKG